MADTFQLRLTADRWLDRLDAVIRLVIVVTMAGMVTVVASQVFARYILNSSFGWADEVSRLLFVTSIFLAIPLGVRRGSHIGIELITTRLPEIARSWLARLVAAAAAVLMLVVAFEGIRTVVTQWDELMVSVDISAGWFLVGLVIGSVHTALHLLRQAAFGPGERAA